MPLDYGAIHVASHPPVQVGWLRELTVICRVEGPTAVHTERIRCPIAVPEHAEITVETPELVREIQPSAYTVA